MKKSITTYYFHENRKNKSKKPSISPFKKKRKFKKVERLFRNDNKTNGRSTCSFRHCDRKNSRSDCFYETATTFLPEWAKIDT